MNSGVHKPPLAPKPKLGNPQRPVLSPSTPRREGLSLPSPGTPRRAKPVLAPKPCLSKLTPAVESKPITSTGLLQKSVAESPHVVGLLNSQNGTQENKKPDWDYIIPICLCSLEKCQCFRNTTAAKDKVEKELKTSHRVKHEENQRISQDLEGVDNSRETTDTVKSHVMSVNPPNKSCLEAAFTNTNLNNHKPLQVSHESDKYSNKYSNSQSNASSPRVNGRQYFTRRTWSDEANDNIIPQCLVGQRPKADTLALEQTPRGSRPTLAYPKPVPVPRKPRTSVLAPQEKVEAGREDVMSQEGRGVNVSEVKVPSEGKDSPSLSVSVPAYKNNRLIVLAASRACAPPASPPKKEVLLSASVQVPSEAHSKDVEEEDLGLDLDSYEMGISVDEDDEEKVDKQTEGQEDQEGVYSHSKHWALSRSWLEQPEETSQPPVVSMAAENQPVTVLPWRDNSLSGFTRKEETSEGKANGRLGNKNKLDEPLRKDFCLKERTMRELPSPPQEKTSKNHHTPGLVKSSRSSLGKKRAKSFSGADLITSGGQRKNSFRKLLDLKLSVKMLPKLKAKGGQGLNGSAGDLDHSADSQKEADQGLQEPLRNQRKFSCPLIGIEQSVDGEDELLYENMRHYEEIPDYMNVDLGETSPRASLSQPTVWGIQMYNDEGIYEEQEPYMAFGSQLGQIPTERVSVHDEVTPLGIGPSDDDDDDEDEDDHDFGPNTSSSAEDDDKDSSSVSSKGDAEQPEERETQPGQNKTKIHYIASEIMSSESVFVDVLKLLHVDFRDAVSEASEQNGKPVIEERLLSQILYSLPQLFELNQDLLKELRLRLATWEENAQLADIFLKKGPYLKMYSTYIREFDKNVALLEEQCKRNPAFAAVVREFEATPRCAGLALKHYLLKPVQRIPQYQLLLTDYLKNLSEHSADYTDTQAALALVKEVANHANDIIKQGDNFQKLIQVQDSLNGHHEIVQPGRSFLKEGILMKLSRKIMQPRMFFLFNDMLLYTTPVQSGQYKLNNMLSLAGMKVCKPNQEAYQNELNIESVERSFILYASSATERDDWLQAISTAIDEFTKKKISFIPGKPLEEAESQDTDAGGPLGSKAPIWIPDLRTTMCMICTCEFSLTWRRHHCRACGKVVCQSCSSHKHRLKYLKNQLARVCDQCFHALQQQKSETSQSTVVSPGSKSAFPFSRKQKKIPAALKEVSASTDNSTISGYLHLLKSRGNKKQGKKLWFVIKDKVLYMYAASEDVAALESQPLLGLLLKEDSSQKLQFRLYHKHTLYYSFKADDIQTAQRWINSFKEATIL